MLVFPACDGTSCVTTTGDINECKTTYHEIRFSGKSLVLCAVLKSITLLDMLCSCSS